MPIQHRFAPPRFLLDDRQRPLTVAAVTFVVLVCLSLTAEFVWSRWNAREAQLSEKQTATSNMAHALAQHAENSVKVADTLLLGVVERLETDGTGAASLTRLEKFVRAAELPLLFGVFVFDADRRQLVNSQAPGLSQVNGNVRDYFRYHREHAGGLPFIGQPMRSLSTGEWIITVSRRVDHADGGFAGVAVAAINLRHFKHFYDSFDIGVEGTIFLALDNGALLVRRARDETTNRQNIADGPVFRHYRANGPVGTALLTARADNIERLYERIESVSPGARLVQAPAAPATAAPATLAAFALDAALKRARGKRTLLRQLVQLLLQDLPETLAALEAALAAGDARLVERTAHRLRGAAFTVCAEPLAAAAAGLEMAARDADPARMRESAGALRERAAELAAELNAFMENDE